MIVYNIPIFVPTSRNSDICVTHGVMTEINAPEKIPYVAANNMSETRALENSQNIRQERPERKAEGMRRLNRPMASAK